MSSEQTRIIGVGNPLMGDDGFGIAAIARLQQEELPATVELVDGGCGGIKLLPLLADCRQLIIIDAADFGAEPGSSKILGNNDLARLPVATWRQNNHHFGLAEILDAAQKLKQLPPTTLYLVQIKSCLPGYNLSFELVSAFTGLIRYINGRHRAKVSQKNAKQIPAPFK